jgi:hypothetical protein
MAANNTSKTEMHLVHLNKDEQQIKLCNINLNNKSIIP